MTQTANPEAAPRGLKLLRWTYSKKSSPPMMGNEYAGNGTPSTENACTARGPVSRRSGKAARVNSGIHDADGTNDRAGGSPVVVRVKRWSGEVVAVKDGKSPFRSQPVSAHPTVPTDQRHRQPARRDTSRWAVDWRGFKAKQKRNLNAILNAEGFQTQPVGSEAHHIRSQPQHKAPEAPNAGMDRLKHTIVGAVHPKDNSVDTAEARRIMIEIRPESAVKIA